MFMRSEQIRNGMKSKIILSDCDGVLVNWIDACIDWAVKNGNTLKSDHQDHYAVEDKFEGMTTAQGLELVYEFNETECISSLVPERDALKYIPEIVAAGYRLHVITAITDNPVVVQRRVHNLKSLYGDIFTEITCVGNNKSKTEHLAEYKDSGCYWIEDSPTHAIDGHKLGLETILMAHDHNVDFDHDDIHVVNNWKEIHALIMENI